MNANPLIVQPMNSASELLDPSTLAVVIHDVDGLEGIFGASVLNHAFSEIHASIDEMAVHLLAQRNYSRLVHSPGHWAAVFCTRSGQLLGDEDETRQAIFDALEPQVEAAILRVFGAGSGSSISYALVVQPLPVFLGLDAATALYSMDDDLLARQIQERLQCLPKSRFRQVGLIDPNLRAELRSIFLGRSLRTLLQPIVCLADGSVAGYEALTRGPKGSLLEFPDKLFSASRSTGDEVKLELLCAELALERTEGLVPEGKFLTINLGPKALLRAVNELQLAGRSDVMIELTEHMPLDEIDLLVPAVKKLRELGVGFVLDDTGCGFADLDTAAALRPDIVKLCITVVRQAGASDAVQAAIGEIVKRLQDLDCVVLAEGIETEAQRGALSIWPIELAQGWLYARPAAIESFLEGATQLLGARISS